MSFELRNSGKKRSVVTLGKSCVVFKRDTWGQRSLEDYCNFLNGKGRYLRRKRMGFVRIKRIGG